MVAGLAEVMEAKDFSVAKACNHRELVNSAFPFEPVRMAA
jgi:hypothetical protein